MITEHQSFSESKVKTTPIITVENECQLKLEEQKYNLAFAEYVGNKLLVLGAVGKMRIGKSASLNNFYCILTGRSTRPYADVDCAATRTKGIHLVHIPFGIMTESYKTKILDTFGEQVDVVLLDCEGTESQNLIQETSKLYLLNMLINSVIHIHVQKRIDRNFRAMLLEAFISSNQIVNIDNQNQSRDNNSLMEILPSIYILVKDADQEWWENTRREKQNITKYEDLLNDYADLKNNYNQLPHKKIEIVDEPWNDGRVLVEEQNSPYWQKLKVILDESLTTRKLKTKEELLDKMRKFITVINGNKIMSVRTQVQALYKNMLDNEEKNLLKSIITNSIENFSKKDKFSPQEIKNCLNTIKDTEVKKFKNSIKNLSCKDIFQSMESKVDEELNKLVLQIESVYSACKDAYFAERERSKIIESVHETMTFIHKKEHLKKFHGEFIEMCKKCGNDPNSKGCEPEINKKFVGGKTVCYHTYYHPGPGGIFCKKCRGDQSSEGCYSEKISDVKNLSEKKLSGFNENYTMGEWKDSNFKSNACEFFNNYLKSLK